MVAPRRAAHVILELIVALSSVARLFLLRYQPFGL
jgi:hypothetical protein